jgi:hypothetical protein
MTRILAKATEFDSEVRKRDGALLAAAARGRADQQDRWAQRGDARGVYELEGAELMKEVDP